MAVASVTIKGQNNIGEAVKSASKDLNTLADSAKKAGKIFATAFGVGSAVAVIKKATSEMKKFVESVDDPKLKSNFEDIKSNFTEIKTTIKDVVSYSIGPLVEKFSHFFSDIKGNIENIVIYIGAVIKNLPLIVKDVLTMIFQMVKRLFSWDGLKIIMTSLFDNIVSIASFALKAVFQSIPKMLWDLLSGIMLWFNSLALGLEASLLEAIEKVLNKAQDAIAGSFLGKILGMDKSKTISLGSDKLRAAQANSKASSQAAFGALGSEAVNLFHDFIDTAQEIGTNTAHAFDDLFGDIIRTNIKDIADGVTLTATEMKEYVSEAKTARAQAAAASGSTPVKFGVGMVLAGMGSGEAETPDVNLKELQFNMKAFNEGLLASIEPFTQVMELFSQLGLTLDPMQEIIDSFMSTLGDMIKVVLQPLHDLLSWIGSSLAETLAPILEVLGNWIQVIVHMLGSVLAPVIQAIGAVFQILAPIFDVFTPILKLVAQAFMEVAKPIKWFADLLSWLGSWMKYFGECVSTVIYNIAHPLNTKGFGSNPGSFHSNAFTSTAVSDSMWEASTSLVGTSASTAVSSASYQGATQVTINIYQQSPVVGDGGMRAFAKMIHDEFDALAYYGV